jgi:hypothetical protein
MTQFDPTAGLDDFDAVPRMRDAWSQKISKMIDLMNFGHFSPRQPPGALDELQAWGGSEADLRFFNPAAKPIPAGSDDKNVLWSALPTSFDQQFPNRNQRFAFLDAQQPDPQGGFLTRVQDEYNEWVVIKDADDKIIKVVFTSEPALYYDFMASPPDCVDKAASQALLLSLYHTLTGDQTIPLTELFDRDGNYDWFNSWNNRFAIHMQQGNNTLGAEVNIAARSALRRKDTRTGVIKSGAAELIACGRYGEAQRQSDPSIGATVNEQVRDNRFITLQNPVGLYMTGLDTGAFKTPDNADPAICWNVTRGTPAADPNQARIVRAEFFVPPGHNYTVSDIKIGGNSIRFGAQIAEHIGMRLGVTVSPPADGPLPTPIGCLSEIPRQTVAAAAPLASAELRNAR